MQHNSIKEKFLLIAFGSAIGLGMLAIAYPFLGQLVQSGTPEAGQFESIDDLRKAMLKRDKRDLKPDQSVSLRSIIHPHPSDQIMFDLLPNLHVKFQGVPVHTNSCGMRDVERSIEKPADTYRIALLGDSFAFGWGVEQHESFAAIAEQILNSLVGERVNVEILNFGVPGYSTFQQVALYEERVIDFKPDAVLVYFIDNDFGLPFFIKDIHNNGRFLSSHSFAKKSWAKKDDLIVKQNSEILDVLDPNKALRKLEQIASEQGSRVFVAINPNKKWEWVQKRLWILRRKNSIQELSLRQEFLHTIAVRKTPIKTLSLPDDPHPSAVKHQILGELLAAALYGHIREALPPTL